MKKDTLFTLALIAVATLQTARSAETQKQPDQTIVLEGAPSFIGIPNELISGGVAISPKGLSQSVVERLIAGLSAAATAPTVGVGAAATCSDGRLTVGTYYILHLVKHEKLDPATRTDAWYTFTCSWLGMSSRAKLNDPDFATHFREARLFGAKKLSFLYLHYGVPVGTPSAEVVKKQLAADWLKLIPRSIPGSEKLSKDSLDAFWKSFEEANPGVAFRNPDTGEKEKELDPKDSFDLARTRSETEIKRLAAILGEKWLREFEANGDRISGPRGGKLLPVQNLAGTETSYVEADFLPITYKIDVLKKNPVWRDNLKAVLTQFGLESATLKSLSLPMEPKALFGYSLNNEINYPTSDISITGIRGKTDQFGEESRLISTKKYDNEKKYLFDFGFAVPIKSVKELSFNNSGQVVQPKPVEKNRIYGTVSIFPLGLVDTKASKLFRFSPEILYGMSMDSSPWDHHLIALGLGLKWAQPFVGVTANHLAIAAADGTVARYKWGWRLTYGVKIPVSAIGALIKKESK